MVFNEVPLKIVELTVIRHLFLYHPILKYSRPWDSNPFVFYIRDSQTGALQHPSLRSPIFRIA